MKIRISGKTKWLTICAWFFILTLFTSQGSYATCIKIEYWNFKDGRQNPIIVNDPNFLGYFIPKANERFTVGDTDYIFVADPNHPNGARFAAGKHNGIDIIGWVEKVDSYCRIHLFTQDTFKVRPTRTGKIRSVDNRKDGSVSISHTNLSYYDIYGHINPEDGLSVGDSVQSSTSLGVIHTDDPNAFVHLHYGETNENGEFIDPMTHMTRGTRCLVPEPSSLLLVGFGLAGLAWLRKKKLYKKL